MGPAATERRSQGRARCVQLPPQPLKSPSRSPAVYRQAPGSPQCVADRLAEIVILRVDGVLSGPRPLDANNAPGPLRTTRKRLRMPASSESILRNNIHRPPARPQRHRAPPSPGPHRPAPAPAARGSRPSGQISALPAGQVPRARATDARVLRLGRKGRYTSSSSESVSAAFSAASTSPVMQSASVMSWRTSSRRFSRLRRYSSRSETSRSFWSSRAAVRLLAVTGDKRDGIPLVNQLNNIVRLPCLQAELHLQRRCVIHKSISSCIFAEGPKALRLLVCRTARPGKPP